MPILTVEHIGKIYGKRWVALSDVSFSLEEGEFAFIVGPSGAGKSTLLELILMRDKPDSGQIEVAGFASDKIMRDESPVLRRKLGVIFQDFKLLPDMTALGNIKFALRVCGHPTKATRVRADELLSRVGLLHKAKSYPQELSGGERQRIAIARAMVHSPVLLMADEPTGNLDPHATSEIMELLLEINRQGTAILMATHDIDLVERFGFRVIELSEGFLIGDRQQRQSAE